MEFKRETAIAVLDGLQSDGLNNLEITEVLKEALLIHCVSQQSELLSDFMGYLLKNGYLNTKKLKDFIVQDYLISLNCG